MQQATDDALIGDWLVKQSVSAWGPFKNWKKRYVVLCPDRIEWRTGQEDAAELLVKGSLPLLQTTTVTLQPSGDLVIASAGRELVLRGDDENRVQAWQHAVLFVASHQQQEQEERSAAPHATGDDGPSLSAGTTGRDQSSSSMAARALSCFAGSGCGPRSTLATHSLYRVSYL